MTTFTEADDNDNDSGEELLDLDNPAGDADGGEAEDRGDAVAPPLSQSALQAVVAGAAPSEDDDTSGAAEDGGRADTGIPRPRFNAVNEQRKELQRQLDEAQAELQRFRAGGVPAGASAAAAPATPAFDPDAAEEAYALALIDGDTKGAAALRREINAHIQQQAVQQFAAATSQQQMEAAVDDVVNQTFTLYPYLQTDAGAPVQEIIIATARAAEARGVAFHQALADAVNTIAPRFAPGQAPGRALQEPAGPADTRLAKAMRRNAADSLLQPTAVQAGIGNRAQGGKVDVAELSDEAFDDLPEAELKRLRGD